jgi:hypothetical protein
MLPPVAGDGTAKTFIDLKAPSAQRFYRGFQKQ